MSWAHIHLALNHVPVIGVLIVLLLLAVARRRGSIELTRVSYGLLVLLAVVAVVVYLTGEPAEELIEDLPGFSESLVERHEQVALIATVGMAVLGLAALLGLVGFRGPRVAPAWYGPGMLLLALVMGGVMLWTANLGGQIRHSEIRAAQSAALDSSGRAPDESEGRDKED